VLEICLTIAETHLRPLYSASFLKKGGEVPQILLPGFPIRGGEIRIMPYMLQKLLEMGIHEPGVFLILLFHYTLKSPDGLLTKRGRGNIPVSRGRAGTWGWVLNPPPWITQPLPIPIIIR
jgi:hypothetical protein